MKLLFIMVIVFIGSAEKVRGTTWQSEMTSHRDLVALVSQVQEYFKVNNVVVVGGIDEDDEFGTITRLVNLLRSFSSRLVASEMLNFSQLGRYQWSCHKRGIRPLVVVLLSGSSELEAFEIVSRYYPMSEALWLLIFGPNAVTGNCPQPAGNPFQLALDAELLVKCAGSPMIYEWYGLRRNRTKSSELAIWDRPLQKLKLLTRRSLPERRQDFAGAALRVAVVKDSPFVKLRDGRPVGYFAAIVRELGQTLNFTLRSNVRVENYYGSYDEPSRRWSGVIGRLSRSEVDLGLDEFTMTESRLGAVDFSLPILRIRHYIFMKRPEGSSLQWTGYFQVYTLNAWMAMCGMCVLTAAIIVLIRTALGECNVSAKRFEEDYFNVWGIFWQQGLTSFPKAWPLRIAYWSILMKAVILYAIYSACLISFLTISNPSAPFTNIADFIKDGSYNLITFRHGAHYELLMSSKDPLLSKLKNQIPPPAFLPETVIGGFKQLCYPKTALYSTGLYSTLIDPYLSCDVATLRTGGVDSIAITLAKRSQYTKIINYHLQRFKEVGIIQRLMSQVKIKLLPSSSRYNSVNFQEIAVALSILLAGFVLSIFVLVIEITTYRCSFKNGKFNDKEETGKKNFGQIKTAGVRVPAVLNYSN